MADKSKKSKNPLKTLLRTLGFVVKYYPVHCVFVLICLIVTTIVTANGTLFAKQLISDFIQPMLDGTLSQEAGFSELARRILIIAVIYACGVLTSYTANRLLVTTTQGTLKRVRDTLFEKMEKLPISYFDRNERGDIMSIYTNDTDTLRQLISQSVPNIIMNVSTVITALVSMIILSPILTLAALAVVALATTIMRVLAGQSAKYFRKRQQNIGEVNA